MDAEEMYYSVYMEIGSYDENLAEAISVDSDDIGYYLNKAQLEYVRQRFDPLNEQRNGFEMSQRVTDELKPIYTKDTSIDVDYAGSDAGIESIEVDRATLPADLMYLVSHRSEVTYVTDASHIEVSSNQRQVVAGESSQTLVVVGKTVQSDDIYTLLTDPFNKTRIKKPLVDINENNIDIYTDDKFFIERVIINYIRQPQEIIFITSGDAGNQDCELPNFTHEEIVELAASNLLDKYRTSQ